jgi:prepilin-type N-terminal cleavage/methylation domain-containing protein
MKKAFSLIELVVVLVIIGLIVGGITSGQNLIRNAQLQTVITDKKKYEAAVAAFQERYFQLPGDMNNATDFWGAAHTTASTCLTTTGSGTETCNGNGDGTLNNAAAGSQYGEVFTFWQHLANAGLVEGNFTGIAGSAGGLDFEPGINSPASRLSGAGWGTQGIGIFAGNANMYAMDYGGNVFVFGAEVDTSTPHAATMSPEEAWNIDKKVDDGKPAYGDMIANYWNDACAAADNGSHANNNLAASYKLTNSSNQCSFYIRNSF